MEIGIGDEDIKRTVKESVFKGLEKPSSSRMHLFSLADILGMDSDNPFLRWKGIFGDEPRNRLNIDPMNLQRVRESLARQRNFLGLMMNAAPFIGPAVGGLRISEPVLRRRQGQPPEMEFKHYNRLPELTKAVVSTHPSTSFGKIMHGSELHSGVDQIANIHANNPEIRQATALYNMGQIDIENLEPLVMSNLTVDEEGKTAFDKTLDLELSRRGESYLKAGWKPYSESRTPISRFTDSNMKVGRAYIDLDTSAGCVGMCPECYACYGGATQGKKIFANPVPLKLTGRFEDNPKLIRRIGTKGEPNMNPLLWKEIAPEFKEMMKSGSMTQEDLDHFIDQTYDWSYTNEQIQKVGLDSPGHYKGNKYVPGGRDMTFVITKLQSLDNFDPEVIKNLQVSIDPMMPTHFFKALKNIKTLKETYGDDVNVMLRIRSVSTYSDEINSLQKIAVDFANKHELPVLETRVRFKKSDTASLAQLQPEYYHAGGQHKHVSYYPKEQASIRTKYDYPEGKKYRKMGVRTFEIHSTEGPKETNVYMQTRLGRGGDVPKMDTQGQKNKIWSVYHSGVMVGDKLSYHDAQKISQNLIRAEFPDTTPSQIKIREYSIGESPLSQFGLRGDLHKQCNVFNMGGGACEKCKGCGAWLNEERLKAYK
jgi:hypothetical protein